MDKSFSSALRALDPTHPDAMKRAITVLSTLADTDTAVEDKEAAIAVLEQAAEYRNVLEAKVDILESALDWIKNRNSANLQDVLGNISAAIYNFKSAVDAAAFYNRKWFAESLMTDDDKAEIAAQLLAQLSVYTKDYGSLYQLIVDRDFATMEAIRYPKHEG